MRSLHSFPRPLKGILGTEKRELTQTAGIKLYFPKKIRKKIHRYFYPLKKTLDQNIFNPKLNSLSPKNFHNLIHPQLRSSISNRPKMEKNHSSSPITEEDEQVLALPSSMPVKERCNAITNSTAADDNTQEAISIDQIDFANQPSNQTQEGIDIMRVFYLFEKV